MTDKTITKEEMARELESITKRINKLSKRILEVGPDYRVFYEADGAFHIMDGDSDDGPAARQDCIRASSSTYCLLGCGAW